MDAATILKPGDHITLTITGHGTKGDGVGKYGPTKLIVFVKPPCEFGETYDCTITYVGKQFASASIRQ